MIISKEIRELKDEIYDGLTIPIKLRNILSHISDILEEMNEKLEAIELEKNMIAIKPDLEEIGAVII